MDGCIYLDSEDITQIAIYLQRMRKRDLRRSCDHLDAASYYAAYPLRMYEYGKR